MRRFYHGSNLWFEPRRLRFELTNSWPGPWFKGWAPVPMAINSSLGDWMVLHRQQDLAHLPSCREGGLQFAREGFLTRGGVSKKRNNNKNNNQCDFGPADVYRPMLAAGMEASSAKQVHRNADLQDIQREGLILRLAALMNSTIKGYCHRRFIRKSLWCIAPHRKPHFRVAWAAQPAKKM